MKKMPVIFVGHGSPMNIIEENTFRDGWKEMASILPKPKAIICISAHWFTHGEAVSMNDKPETIYDFYGFPEALYEIKYPAPGAPGLAKEIAALSDKIQIDPNYGLDHGTWSVLHTMYPQADIPTLQVSVNADNSPIENYRIGQLLSKFRDEEVLIIGSGNIVHNLQLVDWDVNGGFTWADEFDDYIKQAILNGHHEEVINYSNAGDSARKAFQWRDHFDPLLYVLGASEKDEPVQVFNNERTLGSISMTSYIIG